MECECQHNTAGVDCEHCLPLYNNRPWLPGQYVPYPTGSANPCESKYQHFKLEQGIQITSTWHVKCKCQIDTKLLGSRAGISESLDRMGNHG